LKEVTAMSHSTPTPYVFDRTEADHERLIRQARLLDDFAREACLRIGLGPGQRAIDVGCGPLGVLPVLADLVGPDGMVVGLDVSPAALTQARRTLGALGVRSVHLVEADLSTVRPETVAPHGPFDLAVCPLVLMYQADPAAVLRRIATLVRPGGRIVATDVLHDPHYPCFDPPVPAAERIIRLFFALVERKGGTTEVTRHYRALCAQAGLRLVEQRGWFMVAPDPGDLVTQYRDLLLSMCGNLVACGLATEEEIAALAREMDAARDAVQFVAASLVVEMVAEVP
jgi:ubiquinone/menaquinone biosynthesis C-methylase UbiE